MARNMRSLGQRLVRGEESAFAELYDACADRLHRYLTIRLGSSDRASDVLQATFLRAVNHRRKFARVENTVAYLFQMARNEAMRACAKRRAKFAPVQSVDECLSAEANHPFDDADAALQALRKLDGGRSRNCGIKDLRWFNL